MQHRDAIVAAVGIQPGMAVADVGAGSGLFLAPFAEAVGPNGTLFAVEIGERLVEALAARAAEGGYAQVEAVLGSPRSVGLDEGSVDTAFLCNVYHHVEHPRTMLASLRATIRPGGTLFIVDFERIPEVSSSFILGHVRADKAQVTEEVEDAGFTLVEEVTVAGVEENYLLRFRRPR
ncbi:MAG: class I SAM-dependent methyltransferase [Sandaracinaceae bacterium]